MKRIYCILLLNILFISTYAQLKKDTAMIERFNFEITNGGKDKAFIQKNGWLIVIDPPYSQYEFAPIKEFYQIQKTYYKNGILREKRIYLGRVRISSWEYFDEEGHQTKVVDEDAKFGTVKPRDIVKFIEEQGIFNRETGESIFYDEPLMTDGNFYQQIIGKLQIELMIPENTIAKETRARLKMERYDNEKKHIPVWIISHCDRINTDITTYYIDGNDIKNFFVEKTKLYIEI
ncbi:hypothetical protein FACS1894177_00900 [Bacteroidia bacterium]|nr:hypothetical protein FACS1894177_00900 [Bacteroidia bacterium]